MHFARPWRHAGLVSALLPAALFWGLSLSPAVAQENRYVPFDQNAPVGRVGLWVGQMGKGMAGVLQSVQVSLPSKGKVTVYNGGRETGIDLGSPAQFNVGIGFVYRLRLADMPEFPGIELYPTIEMIDRLHPPAGRAQDFPIPIRFTAEEIESAIDGRLVTKVVYLEQPQLAVTGDLTQAMLARFLPPDRNLLIEADRAGRPMILVRIGSRTPDDSRADAAFFLPPAPFRLAELHARPSEADSGHTVVIDKATTFTPAVPRSEIEPTDAIRRATRRGLLGPTPPRPYFALEPPAPPWELYPDEYLLDGGDRGLPVHETPGHREGLDTEDAVAEYVDHAGNAHLLPTNRVAIYSPRFGFVGTKTGLEAGRDGLSRGECRRPDAWRRRAEPGRHGRPGTADAVAQRARAVAGQRIRHRGRPDGRQPADHPEPKHGTGRLARRCPEPGSPPKCGSPTGRESLANGRPPSPGRGTNSPSLPLLSRVAQQVVVKFVASELVGIEDRRKPGRLEIVKLADKQIAQPGEIVSFRIEYENIGDRELKDVRIIDNLTPRLEYVADSATSSRPAALSVTDNGEGSVILTWSLKEPLKGKTKGFVTFKSRVR